MSCPFCPPFHSLIDYKLHLTHGSCSLLLNPRSTIPGSCMIVPHAHKEDPFTLEEQEVLDQQYLLRHAKEVLETSYNATAFTVGWNIGSTAGQHVHHAHLHVVPRYSDEPFAGRGLRYWIKSEANRRDAVPIEIVSSRETWYANFIEVKELLTPIVQNSALSIDHIGSTAVPGLSAKDRIDVQITLSELSESVKQTLDEALELHGLPPSRYASDHRPPGDIRHEKQWKKLFISGVTDRLSFQSNIHVRVYKRANQEYALLFRDYLRSNSDAATSYAACKLALASHHRNDRNTYSDLKDPICDLIMLQARAWAIDTQWTVDQAMDTL